jgi:hypothetical protein
VPLQDLDYSQVHKAKKFDELKTKSGIKEIYDFNHLIACILQLS